MNDDISQKNNILLKEEETNSEILIQNNIEKEEQHFGKSQNIMLKCPSEITKSEHLMTKRTSSLKSNNWDSINFSCKQAKEDQEKQEINEQEVKYGKHILTTCSQFKIKIMHWTKLEMKIKVALVSEFTGMSEASINTRTAEFKWGAQKIRLDDKCRPLNYCNVTNNTVRLENIVEKTAPLKILLQYFNRDINDKDCEHIIRYLQHIIPQVTLENIIEFLMLEKKHFINIKMPQKQDKQCNLSNKKANPNSISILQHPSDCMGLKNFSKDEKNNKNEEIASKDLNENQEIKSISDVIKRKRTNQNNCKTNQKRKQENYTNDKEQ